MPFYSGGGFMIINQTPLLATKSCCVSAALNCIGNCSTNGGYKAVPINEPCSDYSTVLDSTIGQRSDTVNLTAPAHFTVAFDSGVGLWRNLSVSGPSAT
ncbi:unnamed protein product [Didymodactylos carnosus]|uniref:Uncharacterized protein n=1 Tax=Didymodactylos carnosus TaxID=1234261 RepID=A0A815VR67_9BILA|nr:unnamed protein product [Didymodactylos carnosus]CAF1536193.1 unnamed protein product [Didymodactylos carnosus]CAF4219729.1 unnamed protein product [Didymodactylos carnosus]CAF4395954.1 unnamed protein product [Didymodactylos carnosus]